MLPHGSLTPKKEKPGFIVDKRLILNPNFIFLFPDSNPYRMNRLPELIQNAFGTFTLAVAIVLTVLGIFCLISGKRFYWIAVGINGFLISYVSIRGAINWSDWQEFALAGAIGMAALLLSLIFEKFAVAINVFFVFGLIVAAFINHQVQFDDDSIVPIGIFFVTGSLFAFLSFRNMELWVQLLSCVVGALALTVGIIKFTKITPNALIIFLIWIVISVIGLMWQQSQVKDENQDEAVIEDED